jgi:hypothetical protein
MKKLYQLALRRLDNEQKQYIIEHDMITIEKEIDQSIIKEIANRYQCDVQATFIGDLIESETEIVIDATYHTKEMIQKQLEIWQENQRKDFTNEINNQNL